MTPKSIRFYTLCVFLTKISYKLLHSAEDFESGMIDSEESGELSPSNLGEEEKEKLAESEGKLEDEEHIL